MVHKGGSGGSGGAGAIGTYYNGERGYDAVEAGETGRGGTSGTPGSGGLYIAPSTFSLIAGGGGGGGGGGAGGGGAGFLVDGNPGGTGGTGGSGGIGGSGGSGGSGGHGGSGGPGGGGAGGTILMAASIFDGAHFTVNCAGGAGGSGAGLAGPAGQAGRLILASDGGTAEVSLSRGALVRGNGADIGLHARAVHLGADAWAPRLVGLAQGAETSGILARSAGDLMLNASSACPVISRSDVTPDGYAYDDYDVLLIAAGLEDLLSPLAGIDAPLAPFLDGADSNRTTLDKLAVGQAYGLLIPKAGGQVLNLEYKLGLSNLKVGVDLDSLGLADLVECRHTSIEAVGSYDLTAGPLETASFILAEQALVHVRILGGPESLDALVADSAALGQSGTLLLDFTDYRPTAGQEYCFLSADQISGRFAQCQVLGFDEQRIQADLSGGSFMVVPEPMSLILLTCGTVLLRRRSTAGA